MKKSFYKLIFTFLLIFTSTTNFFAESSSPKEEGFNPTPKILHHIQDSYEWHLWGDVSIPLPVILYTEGNLDIFMSSSFNHGKSPVIKGDRKYNIDLHKDFKDQIVEENNKEFISFSITKNVASMILSALLLFFLLRKITIRYKNKKEAPKGAQAFLEPLILFVRDDII